MAGKTQVTYRSVSVAATEGTDHVSAPAWASELVAAAKPPHRVERSGDLRVELRDADEFALTSAWLADAVSLDAEALERRVADVYAAIARKIATLTANRPVRLWNHIPSIHQRMDARRDRYMVFNAGRYGAFAEWYGGPQAFGREVATASGVGHDGRDLVVHCLTARAAGVAVENPRQIAPHRYSSKYGPLPPCFARAAILEPSGLILVGGTASIRGEASLHGGSLPLQLCETLTNLASVIAAAHAKAGVSAARGDDEWLARYREARVYYPRAADGEALAAMTREAFGDGCRIEMRRADLCRAELLVEIEGVASLVGS